MLTFIFEEDGDKFTCHGCLDSYSEWRWQSLYIGELDPDDRLKFFSNHCEPFLTRLGEKCRQLAIADLPSRPNQDAMLFDREEARAVNDGRMAA